MNFASLVLKPISKPISSLFAYSLHVAERAMLIAEPKEPVVALSPARFSPTEYVSWSLG